MVLKHWWMIVIWLALAGIGYVLWRFVWNRSARAKRLATARTRRQVPIAHGERLTQLPSYRAVLRRYHILRISLVACVVVALVMNLALSTRPAAVTVTQPELRNRDIMLCLDVSGSMTPTNRQVIGTFETLAQKFDGERVGLTVFDSSANTVFPLTDDYEFIKDQLRTIGQEMDSTYGYSKLYNGTGEGEGSSLIGDGLASCVMHFDNLDTKRSRSVILVTDNYANGAQIVDIKQAGAYAKDKSVRVYGINPADYSTAHSVDKVAKEFREVVMATDGAYYKLDYESKGDAAVVSQIVEKIGQQEATRFKGSPQVAQIDVPLWFSVVLIAALVGWYVLAWRLLR